MKGKGSKIDSDRCCGRSDPEALIPSAAGVQAPLHVYNFNTKRCLMGLALSTQAVDKHS